MTVNERYTVPEAKKVLVLAPHPDDEVIGCGGTISLYAAMGAEVHVVIVSDGGGLSLAGMDDPQQVAACRKQEALSAAGILGVRQTHFLGFPDGGLSGLKDAVRAKIEDIVRCVGPDILFAPSPADLHPDHAAVADAALQVQTAFPGLRVAMYEIYRSVRFTHLVDISSVIAAKERALAEYRVSLLNVPGLFTESIKGLNRFWVFDTREDAWYEAFWIIPEPLDARALVNWVTYGMQDRSDAEIFLSKVRAIDELFHEFKACSEQAVRQEKELQDLAALLKDRTGEIDELRRQLERMTQSFGWRSVVTIYRVRDILFPDNSLRKKLYSRVVGLMKKQ
ncbi:MAG: PIG-L deacetylase family protein [Thermodesulfovibrionales bacterium]